MKTVSTPSGTVGLTSLFGGILDGNGALLNISAPNLALIAATGIGSSDALETAVSNLAAWNTTSGNIQLVNTGPLTIHHYVAVCAANPAGLACQ